MDPHVRHALIGLLAGCAPLPDGAPSTPGDLADQVLSAPGASDRPYGDPALAVNGVRGAGDAAGSLDVYSLALAGDGASLTLGWSVGPVFDGPGPDLAVFENPFEHAGGVFIDPVVVEVSADGIDWIAFPHDYLADDELAWTADPDAWSGFAGLTPVQLHAEDNPVDPLDPDAAGGDAFDLADLPDTPATDVILAHGACCVRLWSASARDNPDTGAPFPHDPVGNGADIDGVHAAR